MINIKSMPFDSEIVNGEPDRAVNSKEFARYLQSFVTNGVIVKGQNVVGNELRVTDGGGLKARVDTGAIHINGRVGWRDSNLDTLTLSVGGAYPRIDRIVMELNASTLVRSIVLKVLKGTESATPIAPILTRTEEVYQLSLAQVRVNAGSSTINGITDERTNKNACGLANMFVGMTGQEAENMSIRDIYGIFTATNVEDALNDLFFDKVDRVSGKGLSTNDFTNTEKSKLSGIESGAQVNKVTSVLGKSGAVSLTKSDLGLGSVLNYGTATQAEAEAGTSNVKYMTPLRVKEAGLNLPGIANLSEANYVQLTSSGNWSKPSSAKSIYVELWGGGGGGGGSEAGSDHLDAGGGGGGGNFASYLFGADDLTSSVTYVIGAGGTGGDGTQYSSSDRRGGDGGATVFGSFLTGFFIEAEGGKGGYQDESYTNSDPYYGLIVDKGAGTAGGNTREGRKGFDTMRAGPSGGSGGGYNTNDGIDEPGGQGGAPLMGTSITGGSGGAIGRNGSAGKPPSNNRTCGSGGGGGGSYRWNSSGTLEAGHGGNGGIAAGGGGGGASRYTPVGNGGDGGKGIIRLWWW